MLSVPQAAARLGIATKTAWNWIYLRRLPVVRFSGHCVRVSSLALEEMVAKNTVPVLE
jgi:predicted site-specific integrase-resolvase